jgi:hypothetical protein
LCFVVPDTSDNAGVPYQHERAPDAVPHHLGLQPDVEVTDDMLEAAGASCEDGPVRLKFKCCNKQFALARVVNFLAEKKFTKTSVDKGVRV